MDNLNKEILMYITYVSCSYGLNMRNLCYPGMSNTYKHTQRLYSDNTWVTASLKCLISPASNHTKLVRRGDNPKKKILMYIPYVPCSDRLSEMFTCKFEKGPELGVWPDDRSDVSTPSRVKSTIKRQYWSPSGRNPSSGIGPPSEGIPTVELSSRSLPSRNFAPISGAVNLVKTWRRGVTHSQIGCVYSEWG